MKSLPCALLLLSGALNLHAATVIAAADTYVRNNDTATDFGDDLFFVANNASGVRVSFLRFDLSSTIGQTVTNAQLDLVISAVGVGQVFNVYGLTTGENWTETGAGRLNWNASAPGIIETHTAVTGTLSQYLDLSAFFGGGALSSFTSNAATANVSVDTVFNVSSGNVLNFINADSDRIVTFVIAEQDPSDATGNGWNSREAATGKPSLTFTAVPEPSVVALGGLGMLALLRRKRRS